MKIVTGFGVDMKNKKAYLEDVKQNVQQYEKAQEKLFEEMIKKLGVSKEDKDIFFDYCYNNYKFKHGMDIIESYLK